MVTRNSNKRIDINEAENQRQPEDDYMVKTQLLGNRIKNYDYITHNLKKLRGRTQVPKYVVVAEEGKILKKFDQFEDAISYKATLSKEQQQEAVIWTIDPPNTAYASR